MWSASAHSCPGKARTLQVPEVIARARQIAAWRTQIESLPDTPQPEEDDVKPFLVQLRGSDQTAVIYGSGLMTGLAGPDIPGYVERFGAPLLTDPTVWQDFVNKSAQLRA
jgi:hypothetical protein